VSEETGLLVEIDQLTGVYKNMTQGIIALVFRCHVIGGTPRPTAEASETTWLTPDEVRERMNPAFAIRLLDALEEHARGPAVRTHDGTDLLADTTTRS
jgi:ADP-ribose pyrophosphatase YjhB (NUDIX family)